MGNRGKGKRGGNGRRKRKNGPSVSLGENLVVIDRHRLNGINQELRSLRLFLAAMIEKLGCEVSINPKEVFWVDKWEVTRRDDPNTGIITFTLKKSNI